MSYNGYEVTTMGYRLSSIKSKNAESFYCVQDFSDPVTKKRTTHVFEKFGTLEHLMSEHQTQNRDEIVSLLTERVKAIREEQAALSAKIVLSFSPTQIIPAGQRQSFNVSYMFCQKILSMLGLKKICEDIASSSRFGFDLYSIVSMLVNTRVLYPGSKRASLESASSFFEAPKIDLAHVYRALPVLADRRYQIEEALYRNSRNIVQRDTTVLFYDCTNFYFEIEEEDDFRKYGKSKENRPNPIVQYGLFMDANGMPLADICFPGNQNEQSSLPTLEKQIEKDFSLSRFICCTDAGLYSFENKLFNDRKEDGAYIVTAPIRKMNRTLQDWAVNPKGWRLLSGSREFNLDELGDTVHINGEDVPVSRLTFYKDRWMKTTKKSKETGKKETLEEHLIVSYSPKYKKYQKHIRDKKLERAEKLLSNPGKIEKSNPRNPRYYISETVFETKTGEVVEKGKSYSIDYDKVAKEERFDGFYAVTTDLEDKDLGMILQVNRNRWEIEECFEIMKSELETRPIYVSRQEAIEGHLLICFTALLVYRIIEQLVGAEEFTCLEIFETLRRMDITHLKGPYYQPAFTRSPLTDKLTEIFGYQFQTELVDEKNLKKFNRNSKSKNITQFIKELKKGE